MEISHALLTRFNLPSVGEESIIRAQDGWLRDRWELFVRYTLPSVRAQTCRNFRWLIYFDPESPQWLIDRVAPLVEAGDFIALYRTQVPHATLLADLRDAFSDRHGQLITSNIDNDDGLASDFVDRLQRMPGSAPRAALYLTHGLIKRGPELYVREDRRNAFVAVRESWATPVTCWMDWHTLLEQHMPVVESDGPPAWLQVIHGANVSNRVRGRLVAPEPYRAAFIGLLDDVTGPGPVDRLKDSLMVGPVRDARDAARRWVKGALLRLAGKSGLERIKRVRRSLRTR